MLASPNANVVVTRLVGNAPLQIPLTVGTAANVIDNPSDATSVTLLNLSTASSGNWYLIIVSVFIPVKLLPAHVATPVTPIFNLSTILKPVGTLLCKITSASKSITYPDTEDVSW